MGDLPQYNTPPSTFEAPVRLSVPFTVILCCACLLSPGRLPAKLAPALVVVVKGRRRADLIDRFLARADGRSSVACFFACQKSHHNVARRSPLDRNRHKRLEIGGKVFFPHNRHVSPSFYLNLGYGECSLAIDGVKSAGTLSTPS